MYTVLLVEDEVLVCAGLKSMIRWEAMDMVIVGEARNGKQGLELYHKLRPDVILTDLKMPVMGGLEMISQIRKEDTDTRILVLTCYEDFDLVRQAFLLGISDYILKLSMMPDQMEEVVAKVRQELADREDRAEESDAVRQMDQERRTQEKCRDYILKHSGSYEEIRPLIQSIGLSERGLAVCIMKMLPAALRQHTEDRQYQSRVEQIVLHLMQNLLPDHVGGAVWKRGEGDYLITLSLSEAWEAGEREGILQDILRRTREVMRSRLNREVLFGISGFTDSYGELNRLYQEAIRALEEAVLLEKEQVFYMDPEIHLAYEAILTEFEKRLGSIGSLADQQRCRIAQEIRNLKARARIEGGDMREAMIRWIHWISFDAGMQKEEVTQLAMEAVEQIRSAATLREMCQVAEECIGAVYQGAEDTTMVSREVAKTIAYIREHYQEEGISLSAAAQEAAIHKNYLSRLFKQETGIGFANYVNLERMKKARELLVSTNMKTYEVAQAVGFSDESYFCHVFKKLVGVRPNEYKKRGLQLPEEANAGEDL